MGYNDNLAMKAETQSSPFNGSKMFDEVFKTLNELSATDSLSFLQEMKKQLISHKVMIAESKAKDLEYYKSEVEILRQSI